MATQSDVNNFIQTIAPSVILKCQEHGWGVPSAIIAQAGIESAWGTSGLWKTCFNGWGMKWVNGCGCNYKEYSTKEQKPDGTYYTVVAKFRKYPDVASGINGYFQFIESYKRYRAVMESKNYTEYATQLKQCGWATSINYTNTIINTVKKYNLTIYDSGNVPEVITDKTRFYCPTVTYTTQVDLYIRDNADGNKIKYDCITQNAKANSKFDAQGYAILLKGSRVTCKEVIGLDTSVWLKIPSGYVCAINGNKVYVS